MRGRIENILDWAHARELRTGDNPARWRGLLEHTLTERPKSAAVRHHPALPYSQIAQFMRSLREQEGTAARALEFVILTASRTSEVLGARWSEINFDEGLWIVPASRIKTQREHRVPLSNQALAILRAQWKTRVSDFIFPGARDQRPLSNMALLVLLRRMKRDELTVHGFRSTFRDWTADCTAYPREVAEMSLAHAIGDKVEAAYRRGDLFEKRRLLMTEWAAYCDRVEPNAKVISLRRKNSSA